MRLLLLPANSVRVFLILLFCANFHSGFILEVLLFVSRGFRMKLGISAPTLPGEAFFPVTFYLALAVSILACYAMFPPCGRLANMTASLRLPRAASASPAELPVVYVSDFELDILRARPGRTPPPRNSSGSTSDGRTRVVPQATAPTADPSNSPPASPDKFAPAAAARPEQKEDPATQEANELVTTMAENLVSALEKAGFSVQRLHAGAALPKAGLRIRGVFAEPDERNRVRRLLVGSDSGSPRILLYVGVNNLGQPEQPLYELANPPSNDGMHGPVITVTSYSPAARFEMGRSPSDEEFKKIATQIATDLTALLNANPLARIQ
jgi:hypothetical protein